MKPVEKLKLKLEPALSFAKRQLPWLRPVKYASMGGLVCFYSYSCFFEVMEFAGPSMQPTIASGELGLCRKVGSLPKDLDSLKKWVSAFYCVVWIGWNTVASISGLSVAVGHFCKYVGSMYHRCSAYSCIRHFVVITVFWWVFYCDKTNTTILCSFNIEVFVGNERCPCFHFFLVLKFFLKTSIRRFAKYLIAHSYSSHKPDLTTLQHLCDMLEQ